MRRTRVLVACAVIAAPFATLSQDASRPESRPPEVVSEPIGPVGAPEAQTPGPTPPAPAPKEEPQSAAEPPRTAAPERPQADEPQAATPPTPAPATPPTPAPATPPTQAPATPPAAPRADIAASAVPPGQWVYTAQYGWVWMPYDGSYTYAPHDGWGDPYMYMYASGYGWGWLAAPWIWGWGPWPAFGVGGPGLYAWYGWGWWRQPWRYGPGYYPGHYGPYRSVPFRPGGAPYGAYRGYGAYGAYGARPGFRPGAPYYGAPGGMRPGAVAPAPGHAPAPRRGFTPHR
jgi:hypothetical protein